VNRIAVLPFALLLTACPLDEEPAPAPEPTPDLDPGDDDDAPTGPAACAPVQALSCGDVVAGDTSTWNGGATDLLDAYPVGVGNYAGREIAYSFVAPADGEVEFAFVDPQPSQLDQDLFLLSGSSCEADSTEQRGFNSLSFDAVAGEAYVLVVDGFAGAEGAFEVEVVCDEAEPVELAGEGDECDADDACADGLVCAGATTGYGLCNPDWMRDTFFWTAGPVAIPDGDADGLEVTLPVSGLASVSTDVQVSLLINHPAPSDLVVTLTNPDTTEAVVIEDATAPIVLQDINVFGFPGDESVNGPWTLRVTDEVRGDAGELIDYSLTLTSRWD
jgi:hypothetical protein